jgi:hypothetical protein
MCYLPTKECPEAIKAKKEIFVAGRTAFVGNPALFIGRIFRYHKYVAALVHDSKERPF